MNQFVKIVRFVTTSVFYVTCVPWNCVGITLFILWWFFLLHKNNKYFRNNYGSSFRDLEVTVLTKNHEYQNLVCKNMVKFDNKIHQIFYNTRKKLIFELRINFSHEKMPCVLQHTQIGNQFNFSFDDTDWLNNMLQCHLQTTFKEKFK